MGLKVFANLGAELNDPISWTNAFHRIQAHSLLLISVGAQEHCNLGLRV